MPDTASSNHFELLPASSTMTTPQATVDPISEAGGTAGKPYLRKGKTLPKNEGDKEKKKCKNQPCNTEVREGRRCSRCRSRDFPVSLGDTMVQQEFPRSPWKGPCKSRYLQTAAHGGPYTRPGGYAQKEPAACGELMLEQVYHGVQPMERTHTRAGEKCEEERAAKRNCYGLTTSTIPLSTCAPWFRG